MLIRGDALRRVAEAVLAQTRQQPTGLASRLMSGFGGLVKVRRQGAADGDSSQAIVSRVAARLAANDATGARAEWDKLPSPARAAAAEFDTRLKARVDGEILIEQIRKDALARLAAASAKSE